MQRYLFLVILLLATSSKAQFYKQTTAISHLYSVSVNPDYVREQKIKSLRITYAWKEDGQRIQSKNTSKKIYFNTNGLPFHELDVVESDSSETFYYYHGDTLAIKRKFTLKEILAVYVSFGAQHQPSREVRCKEFPANPEEKFFSREFFKLGKQEVIWTESYSYESLSKNQTRKKTYNDKEIVYKEGIVYTDEHNLTNSEISRFTATGVSENNSYIYDTKNQLLEKTFYTDVAGILEEKTIFTYDANGNVSTEKFYRNSILQKELIYFYSTNGKYPEAILTKYPNRKTIDMQTIQVEFYP
ncbi:MAG: hypothetical protein IPP32_05730 [Bacteroidetes bacterium]|nr:hypothetical protein [Bacteroidota bacterium]